MTYIEKIIDTTTGEETIRPFTDEEIAQVETQKALAEAEQAERDKEQAAKAQQRAAVLERLGLNEEEAKLLLG